jgi:lysophospholipase L1-like esterase
VSAFVSGLAAAMLLTLSYTLRDNTLEQNGRWASSKVGLARGVMGAVAYLTTHTALARNRLNLGAWHGYQELFYAREMDLRAIDFDFELPRGSYLSFIHRRDERGYFGVRLSNAEGYPSEFFRASGEGEFLDTRPASAALKSGKNHLRAVFSAGRVALEINGKRAGEAESLAGPRQIGFRGSFRPTYVDDVVFELRDGSTIRENFSGHSNPIPAFAGAAFFVLLYAGLMSWRKYSLTYAQSVLAIGAAAFVLLDWFYLSGLHPRIIHGWGGHQTNIETEAEVRARLRRELAAKALDERARILFIGSSQTWGAGAARLEDVFVTRACARLEADGAPVSCVNTGISGLAAARLVELYKTEWVDWKPDVVVVNLSNNDWDEDAFETALDDLARLDASKRIATFFVAEANSTENDEGELERLERKHARLRAVAARHGIKVLDLHRELARTRDRGFLWWDFVHLTSYGQRLAAEYLAKELEPAIASTQRRTPRVGVR